MDTEILKQLDQIGIVAASNKTTDKILKKLKRKITLESRQIGFWTKRILQDNSVYKKIIDENSEKTEKSYEDIDADTKYILDVIHKINQGTSYIDAELFANAKWIRLNSNFEPLILADDRDVATCGNLISSFFGIALGVISLFEIIRRLELEGCINEDPLNNYCEHYSIDTPIEKLEHDWKKLSLETKISNLLLKAKIACHPCPRGRGTTPINRIRR